MVGLASVPINKNTQNSAQVSQENTIKHKTNEIVNIFSFSDPDWNSKFVLPELPVDGQYITKLIRSHGMKYLASNEGIPVSWIEFITQNMSFKHPPIYKVVEKPNQTLVFNTKNDTKMIVYYSSSKILTENEELNYFGKTNSTIVDFYDLDGREWLVSTPDNPETVTDITAQTALKDRFINLRFRRLGETENKNFRDEVFKMLSTLKINSQSKIMDYSFKDNSLKNVYIIKADSSVRTTEAKFIDQQNLDYLPFKNRQLQYFQPVQDKGKEYLFVFPSGFISESKDIQKIDQNILPYLQNSKYCQINSDCSYRQNICTFDFYNHYQQVLDDYSCHNEEYYSCQAHPEYESIQCKNNECQGINVLFKC